MSDLVDVTMTVNGSEAAHRVPARTTLADRQQTTQARITAIMAIIQKTQFLENVLANSMSPGMAAALDWSRGVSARGLN